MRDFHEAAGGHRLLFGPNDDADVVVAGTLPSHEIMPRVDVVVTMGGQGSMQTAMSCGTPLVGIPLHPEQELNVDLAVRQGMALAMAPRHAGSSKMSDAIRRLLAEPGFKQQARRVQALYAGVDGAGCVATEIMRCMSSLAAQRSTVAAKESAVIA